MSTNRNHLDHKDGLYLWDLNNPHGYGNRMGRYRTQVEADFILRHLPATPQSVLDAGGGAGRIGSILQARGHRVTLLDKNPQAAEMARKKKLDRVLVGDILDFSEAGFEAVVCMEVLEYFKDCGPVIAKCAEFTQTGGLFIFCIINSDSWRFKLQQLRKNHSDATGFPRSVVEAHLLKNGFEIKARQGFQWTLLRTGSDNWLVNFFRALEQMPGLRNWPGQSPWLLYACRKS